MSNGLKKLPKEPIKQKRAWSKTAKCVGWAFGIATAAAICFFANMFLAKATGHSADGQTIHSGSTPQPNPDTAGIIVGGKDNKAHHLHADVPPSETGVAVTGEHDTVDDVDVNSRTVAK